MSKGSEHIWHTKSSKTCGTLNVRYTSLDGDIKKSGYSIMKDNIEGTSHMSEQWKSQEPHKEYDQTVKKDPHLDQRIMLWLSEIDHHPRNYKRHTLSITTQEIHQEHSTK